jgi:hypothetical protein
MTTFFLHFYETQSLTLSPVHWISSHFDLPIISKRQTITLGRWVSTKQSQKFPMKRASQSGLPHKLQSWPRLSPHHVLISVDLYFLLLSGLGQSWPWCITNKDTIWWRIAYSVISMSHFCSWYHQNILLLGLTGRVIYWPYTRPFPLHCAAIPRWRTIFLGRGLSGKEPNTWIADG